MQSLELGLIGNGTIGALIDPRGEIVWSCFPRLDGDPVFCSLLRPGRGEDAFGFFAVELIDCAHADQAYMRNTAVLTTTLEDRHGGAIEINDFIPRFRQFGRVFHPMCLVRRVRRLKGSPRIRIRLRPACGYGAERPSTTWGSNHIRYVMPDLTLRLTTDASITAIQQESVFFLESEITLLLGSDETVSGAVANVAQNFLDETAGYWRNWVRGLDIPFEWQEEVIRAAMTLKLNAYDDTGAIIAAMTTSIPEAAGSARNWDYRYCWLRDGYFVVNALNRLGSTRTMEHYLSYIANVAAGASDGVLQPVYGIDGRANLHEGEIGDLPGYRDMGPVRVGNLAYRQTQHDVYGSAILAVTHMFFDKRLTRMGDTALFERIESLGGKAVEVYGQPDAGLWELRRRARVHTFSCVMCWAACHRLALIAQTLGLSKKAIHWRARADRMRRDILARAWSDRRKSFVSTYGGNELDASLLLLNEIGFVASDDPRYASTVAAIERELKHGDFIFRYVEKDDFGTPENAFVVCSFWYIQALVAQGRREEARHLFIRMLSLRNRHGLLAEHIDPRTGEHWGNFVQTYSMVGLINSSIRLSMRWDQAF